MKRFVFTLTIALIFPGCVSIGWKAAAQTSIDTQKAPATGASDGWDLSVLDTARQAAFLCAVEKDVILEINKARSNPARYAEMYITPIVRYFRGMDYEVPGRITIVTNEGAAAVRQCVIAMQAQPPRLPLQTLEALYLAARDHAKDTGPRGTVGHTGSDGSDFMARIARYAKGIYGGENISYGPDEAREIVIQFLVDDGVPSRGHRVNIMREEYVSIGVAVGPHKVYGLMCVVDFARKPVK
jgi:uncharacterized protein YkwD